jgi:GNAT superfamily N-acetyltransferase
MDMASLLAHEEATKFKTIDQIEMGKYRCETWYYSPYPEGYHNIECLFICEFCLSFYVTKKELLRHAERCNLVHPPGDEIYREGKVTVFEVDGFKNQTYCENLCYLSKLFLDHKTLMYDVTPFLFFVLCEADEHGHHMVGYFSKEKESGHGWNLSCILTLPFHQRKGYGKFLIAFSYELSLIEGKVGTPERPLSDLGRESYESWWTQKIIDFLRDPRNKDGTFSINDITKSTGIKDADIKKTLVCLRDFLVSLLLFLNRRRLIC